MLATKIHILKMIKLNLGKLKYISQSHHQYLDYQLLQLFMIYHKSHQHLVTKLQHISHNSVHWLGSRWEVPLLTFQEVSQTVEKKGRCHQMAMPQWLPFSQCFISQGFSLLSDLSLSLSNRIVCNLSLVSRRSQFLISCLEAPEGHSIHILSKQSQTHSKLQNERSYMYKQCSREFAHLLRFSVLLLWLRLLSSSPLVVGH